MKVRERRLRRGVEVIYSAKIYFKLSQTQVNILFLNYEANTTLIAKQTISLISIDTKIIQKTGKNVVSKVIK